MSVAFDTNLLLYASDSESKFFDRANNTINRYVNEKEIIYLFWPVAMAYLRISTHPNIFNSPLKPEVASSNISALLDQPSVKSPGEGDRFWRYFESVQGQTVIRGNLVPDAHIVSLMLEYEVPTVISHDRDFKKFKGVKVLDPFA